MALLFCLCGCLISFDLSWVCCYVCACIGGVGVDFVWADFWIGYCDGLEVIIRWYCLVFVCVWYGGFPVRLGLVIGLCICLVG